MKNRILITTAALFLSSAALADSNITLKSCIDAAMKNKAGIQAARTDRVIAALRVKEASSAYIPQISAAYDYRYYAIIPTQVVPVGLFFPVPTSETRYIRFGTNWQQIAGLTLYQPVVDLTIRNRLRESRINEKIREYDLAESEEQLKFEVVNSYLSVWLKTSRLNSAISDTLRTSKTFELLKAGSDRGRVQSYDLNLALINHNRNLSALAASRTELLKERIYLSFLTGISLNELNTKGFDFSVFENDEIFTVPGTIFTDSLASIKKLELAGQLALQQVSTEKSTRTPSLGVSAFLGANQYANSAAPFESGTWHGNSFVGISLKMPITGGTSIRYRVSQLKMEARAASYRLDDEKERVKKEVLTKQADLKLESEKMTLTANNIKMLKDNLTIYQDRFMKGLENSYDIVNQETALQKEQLELEQTKTNLMIGRLGIIKESGALNSVLSNLR